MSIVPSPPSPWQTDPGDPERRIDTALMPTSPVSAPGRRLRGLSYLRNYTSNRHTSSNSNDQNATPSRPAVGRAISYPSPTGTSLSRGSAAPAPASPSLLSPQQTVTITQPGNFHVQSTTSTAQGGTSNTHTSGGLPSVAAPVSRTADLSSTAANNTPAADSQDTTPAMARTRSATTGSGAPDNDRPLGRPPAPPPGTPYVFEGRYHGPPLQMDSHGHELPDTSQIPTHLRQLPSIRFTAHQDPRAQRPSLVFTPHMRILPTGRETIKVGRFSEREHPAFGNDRRVPNAGPVGFKSKVVSRRHCEFWCSSGQWYIKDVKSSSGTFLNHVRLSQPGTESKPYPIKDGDIVQLGIDFKGGEEMIFRCVKIRCEINKDWKSGPTQFNVASHKQLRELNTQASAGSSQDCSICLGAIAPCQPLFVAPCSHTWHYKCIRVIINGPHWPHFICPNCRNVSDLEADFDEVEEWEQLNGDGADATEANAGAQAAQPPAPAAPESGPTPPRAVGPATEALTLPREAEPETTSEELVLEDDSSNSESEVPAEQLGQLDLDDAPSPAHSPDPHTSNATVAPVNIIPRRPVASPRTPSPSGLGSELQETTSGHEGPMTPRNDIGPFVFDGTAGRASTERVRGAAINLDAAAAPAATPLFQAVAQPQVEPQIEPAM